MGVVEREPRAQHLVDQRCGEAARRQARNDRGAGSSLRVLLRLAAPAACS